MIILSTDKGIFRSDQRLSEFKYIGPSNGKYRHIAQNRQNKLVTIGYNNQVFEGTGRFWSRSRIKQDVITWSVMIVGNHIYIGTEPAKIFRKKFGEKRWEEMYDFYDSPFSDKLFTPWNRPAAVRTMASINEASFYADIHVAGVFKTESYGKEFEHMNNKLERDVHQVVTVKSNPSSVYTATYDGFYASTDFGQIWEYLNNGKPNSYCRALAVNPADPNIILIACSPTDPPMWKKLGPRFAIYRTENEGKEWSEVTNGLPELQNTIVTTNCITFLENSPEIALLGTRQGSLYISRDFGKNWKHLYDFPGITSICGF